MVYAFIRKTKYESMEKEQLLQVKKLSKSKLISIDSVIKDDSLKKTLLKLENKDIILCNDVLGLGNSMEKVVKNILVIKNNNISIYSNCGISITPQDYQKLDFIDLLVEISEKINSQKIKEIMAIKKKEGVVLGRPKGQAKALKLDPHKKEIRELLTSKVSHSAIARRFKVHRLTVAEYVNRAGLDDVREEINRKTTLKQKLRSVVRCSLVSIKNHKQAVEDAIEFHSLAEVAKVLRVKQKDILEILRE